MTRQMKAAVFAGNGIVNIKDVPVPQITRPDDVIIKVKACGICGSDLHVLSVPPGQYAEPGTILGHEFTGIVEAVGPEVTSVKAGDKVVAEPNVRFCPILPDAGKAVVSCSTEYARSSGGSGGTAGLCDERHAENQSPAVRESDCFRSRGNWAVLCKSSEAAWGKRYYGCGNYEIQSGRCRKSRCGYSGEPNDR